MSWKLPQKETLNQCVLVSEMPHNEDSSEIKTQLLLGLQITAALFEIWTRLLKATRLKRLVSRSQA